MRKPRIHGYHQLRIFLIKQVSQGVLQIILLSKIPVKTFLRHTRPDDHIRDRRLLVALLME